MKRVEGIKSIVFDMDGVIFDTERACIDAWKVVAEKHNISNIEEVCIACIGTNSNETRRIVLKNYGEDFPYDEYSLEMSSEFKKIFAKGIPVKKGAKELLSFLKENQVKMSIASSTKTATVIKELTEAGLVDYFDIIVGGDQVSRSKPNPDIFLAACEKLLAIPEKTYGIEDSFNGMRALKAAGMRPIMVPDIIKPDDEMKNIACTIREDLFKVIDYFNEEI